MPEVASKIHTTDYHTGGEPFRIVSYLPFELPGVGVADRRARALDSEDAQGLRRLLCFEPRGHADMYGGFLTPADDDGADFGVLFWHKDGFSTACGHGTIALGAWAVESGLVELDPSGLTEVVIDVPSGRVSARVRTDAETGSVSAVDFVNVPSYAIAESVDLDTSLGRVTADIAYGGAIYAHVDAATLDLSVEPSNIAALTDIGREIKWALNDTEQAQHPTDPRLSGVYGTILYEDLGQKGNGRLHQRNVTVFADGEVDRSPCGSGTCSRIAMLAAQGRMADDDVLVHDSIIGARFEGRITRHCESEGYSAIVPMVTGTAHLTGEHTFYIDPRDELVPGFVLR